MLMVGLSGSALSVIDNRIIFETTGTWTVGPLRVGLAGSRRIFTDKR